MANLKLEKSTMKKVVLLLSVLIVLIILYSIRRYTRSVQKAADIDAEIKKLTAICKSPNSKDGFLLVIFE